MMKELSSAPTLVASTEAEDDSEQPQESKVSEVSRRMGRESTSYNPSSERNQTSSFASTHTFTGWEESGTNSAGLDRNKFEVKNSYRVPSGQKMYPTPNMQSSADTEDKVQKESPPRRKVSRDEKPEKTERPGSGSRIDVSSTDSLSTSYKQQSTNSSNIRSIGTRQNELNSPPRDDNINEILEVSIYSAFALLPFALFFMLSFPFLFFWLLRMGSICFSTWKTAMNSPLASANFLSLCVKEEEALIAAHRKEIEDTMDIVREVSKISNNTLKLTSVQNLGIFLFL